MALVARMATESLKPLALADNDPRGPVLHPGYRATALVRSLPTALIHFLIVESRSIILVWLTDFLTAAVSQDMMMARKKEFLWNIWEMNNVFGICNLIVLIYVASFVGINTILMVWSCGICASFEHGKYLAFTYDLEQTKLYRIMVYMLMVLLWGVLCCFFIVLVVKNKWFSLKEFWVTFGSNFLAAVALTGALLQNEGKRWKDKCCTVTEPIEPDIDWKTNTFKNMKFTRTIKDLFVQTNDSFAARITIGCWKATGNNFRSLWSHVHDDYLEEALRIEPY